jgi:hypothetical protein
MTTKTIWPYGIAGQFHDHSCECPRHCRNCHAGLVGRQQLYCSDYCGRQWRAELDLDARLSSAATAPR